MIEWFVSPGDKLRTLNVGKLDNLIVEISQDSGGSGSKKPMALVRIPNDHDLVLEFHFMSERKKFLAKLEAFLQGIGELYRYAFSRGVFAVKLMSRQVTKRQWRRFR